MNAIIKNGDLVLSKVMPIQEAEERLKGLKMIYPNAHIERTSQEVIEKSVIVVIPEEIEDTGCAGGGCTL